MGCNRCGNINRGGQVMGEFGTTRIALRGPGCINGTGRCNVAGAQGRCTNVFGTGDDIDRCDYVGGAGGRDCLYDCLEQVLGEFGNRRCCSNVAGTGGRRCNNFVGGTGGRRCDNNVGGTGGRRKHDSCCCLETPITVPR